MLARQPARNRNTGRARTKEERQMAEQITQWKANDGSVWNDQESAEARDQLIVAVEMALAPLGPRPNDKSCDFSNGHGYKQHTAGAVLFTRESLWKLTAPHIQFAIEAQLKHQGMTEEKLRDTAHPSWIGRMLDGGPEPLERAWTRMLCIDAEYREWGQPYYAAHPEAAPEKRRLEAAHAD
jgi:hypothetical protein